MGRRLTAQDMIVFDPTSVTDAIEELENPDRHFASTATCRVQDIAKCSGARGAANSGTSGAWVWASDGTAAVAMAASATRAAPKRDGP